MEELQAVVCLGCEAQAVRQRTAINPLAFDILDIMSAPLTFHLL